MSGPIYDASDTESNVFLNASDFQEFLPATILKYDVEWLVCPLFKAYASF